MDHEPAQHRIDLVARLTEACAAEIRARDLTATISWPSIPTVAAMAVHLGSVHRWVAEILRTGRRAAEEDFSDVSLLLLRDWFEEGRLNLLDALRTTPPGTSCWVLGNRVGTVEFWQRRMVFENAKHLIDLRAAGGTAWTAAPELAPDDYADGVDELLTEFLPRSRASLAALPGSVQLQAIDSSAAWRINPDWSTGHAAADRARVTVTARAADLALMLWERTDLLGEQAEVAIDGDPRTLAALQGTSIHPW